MRQLSVEKRSGAEVGMVAVPGKSREAIGKGEIGVVAEGPSIHWERAPDFTGPSVHAVQLLRVIEYPDPLVVYERSSQVRQGYARTPLARIRLSAFKKRCLKTGVSASGFPIHQVYC